MASDGTFANQQQIVLTQLLQIVTTVRHIDELLAWFAQTIVYRFGVQVTQIWATQANQAGQLFPELRSIACQDVSLPQTIVVNTHVATMAERILSEQHSFAPQLVDRLFAQHPSILLRRYGLHYCASYFLSSNMLLPPANADGSAGKVLTPLRMTLVFFLRQVPPRDFLPALSHLLEQILPIARNRELLFPATARGEVSPQPTISTNLQQQRSLPMLSAIIPRRIEDAASNPIAASVAISDKQARRLYAAINGRRTVDELFALTQLEMKEFYRALQILLVQNRIHLYEPGGQRVNNALLLDGDDQ